MSWRAYGKEHLLREEEARGFMGPVGVPGTFEISFRTLGIFQISTNIQR